MQSYDEFEIPEIDLEAVELARKLGLHIIHVICDEEGAKSGDPSGVSFFTMAGFLPRPGDWLRLEDGNMCQVEKVFHGLSKHGKFTELMPNVLAIRRGPKLERRRQ